MRRARPRCRSPWAAALPETTATRSAREHTGRLVAPACEYADALDVLAGVAAETAIATIGQQTNLAAAVRRDARLARRARELTVMGGSFAPFRSPDGQVHGAERDWNLVLDPAGAVEALTQGWRRLRYVPIDVTFRTVLTRRPRRPPARR